MSRHGGRKPLLDPAAYQTKDIKRRLSALEKSVKWHRVSMDQFQDLTQRVLDLEERVETLEVRNRQLHAWIHGAKPPQDP